MGGGNSLIDWGKVILDTGAEEEEEEVRLKLLEYQKLQQQQQQQARMKWMKGRERRKEGMKGCMHYYDMFQVTDMCIQAEEEKEELGSNPVF